METNVVVISADLIRGNIITKTFKRNGMKAYFCEGISNAKNEIIDHAPGVVVIDTKDFYKKELSQIEDMEDILNGRNLIFLADQSANLSKDLLTLGKHRILYDPLDPELIVKKTAELMLSQDKETLSPQSDAPKVQTETGAIMDDLKSLLSLK